MRHLVSAVCFPNPWERRSHFVGVVARTNYRKTSNVSFIRITVSLVTRLVSDRRHCCCSRQEEITRQAIKPGPRTFHLTASLRARGSEAQRFRFMLCVALRAHSLKWPLLACCLRGGDRKLRGFWLKFLIHTEKLTHKILSKPPTSPRQIPALCHENLQIVL